MKIRLIPKRIALVTACLFLAALLIIPLVANAAVDDSYTVVLLHMDGTDASTTFTDDSGKTWTANGNAQIDTTYKKYGTGAGLFDGTGDYIDVSDSADFDVGSGNFTIDFWTKIGGGNNLTRRICGQVDSSGTATSQSIIVWIGSDNKFAGKIVSGSTGYTAASTSAYTDSNWHHIAFVRNGNELAIYVDGTKGTTTADVTGVTANNSSTKFAVGRMGEYAGVEYNGSIDEFRFSKGIARWTSNFTPPSGQYEPTPTNTNTPTDTATPTYTATATNTGTPTDTPTPTNTPTPTDTPTPTASPTPYGSIIWADGPVTVSAALQTAIADLFVANPRYEMESNIFALTNISGIDTAWDISFVNLIDVPAPYDVWDAETNVAWAWFVECTGTEPTWSCDYYSLPGGGGAGSLRLPWKNGYYAQYGVAGVHAGAAMISGSSAVDFLGKDSWSGSMPPLVIAAANGTITSVCSDGVSMAIRVDGGPVPLAYFHFDTGQSFTEGQTVTQGQVLGQLKYGTFTGARCGYGVQFPDQYHLHFVFLPTSGTYFEIGGCVLDMSTEAFVCNGNTYAMLQNIPNGGASSDPGDAKQGEPGSNTAGGGPHIWDGIVNMIVALNADTISEFLPDQNSIVGYSFQKFALIFVALFDIFMAFIMNGLSARLIINVLGAIVVMDLQLWIVELAASLFKSFSWLRGKR